MVLKVPISMKLSKKVLALFGGLIVTAFITLCAFVAYTVMEAHRFQGEVGQELGRTLGFSHGSPYLFIDGEGEEFFTLHPQPDGILSTAGVQDGDVVLDYSITEFYRALHEHRGTTLNFRVTDGGDGGSIERRKVRFLNLAVP
jgi:hypothetical protein